MSVAFKMFIIDLSITQKQFDRCGKQLSGLYEGLYLSIVDVSYSLMNPELKLAPSAYVLMP